VRTVVCWDIDGTLLTTARAGVFALEEAAREVCGAEPDFAELRTSGLTDAEVAALAIETCTGGVGDARTAAAFLRAYERHLPERLPWRSGSVLPGVKEILDDLAARPDVTCLLLTGNTAAGARAKLSHYGLEAYFADGAFCGDGDDRDTIASRARELARRHSNGAPADDRVFVVGDTPADVRCGLAIGARTIAVASGDYAEEELARAGAWLTLPRLPAPAEFARLLGIGSDTLAG
jgi:phosphoglycolate phosphatase-like HAD superfamily hydrolase